MRPIPESARQVLTSGRLGHLVTVDADGGPQVTCAWIGIENEEIVIATLPDQRKLRNIRRDPRVSLSVETSNLNPHGLTEYLVVYGRARVTEGGGPELLQELASTYIGPGVKFPPVPNPPPGFVTRITPDRFAGIGPWAEG
jgi:PPOX class probable F420-dependent enzyme